MLPDSLFQQETPVADGRHVAILLATYQGGKYLAEQLDSIAKQSHREWSVWASDDGSTDSTWEILNVYQKRWGEGRLHIRRGPQKGFAGNFLSLVCDHEIQADYVAFADQDDIWLPDKLDRALNFLEPLSPSLPGLYASRTCLVDENGQRIGLSPPSKRPPAFANALVQNFASGNTMVMNAAARRLLINSGAEADIGLHDWWAYLLVSGAGGYVVHDPQPTVRYRQHASNLIGMGSGWRQLIQRCRTFWAGGHKRQVQRNLEALVPLSASLTDENRLRLHTFAASRARRGPYRLFGLWRSGVHRQTLLGTLSLWLATILNKT